MDKPEPIDPALAELIVEAVEGELFEAVDDGQTDESDAYVESLREIRERAITGRMEYGDGQAPA